MIRTTFFISILFLFASVFSAFSQDEVTVKISKKKSTVDGKQYYIHTVKKGESLYAISKAYNILQKDIVMDNPDALQGLKPDMTLKIPFTEDKSKFTAHTIEKGETLYSIARKYGVDVGEIQKFNPAVENGLKLGVVLKIPNKSNSNSDSKKDSEVKNEKSTKTETKTNEQIDKKNENSSKQLTHTVEKGETIYGILKKYHITENQLKEANPELQNTGLKKGETIIIPQGKESKDKSEKDKDKVEPIVIVKENAENSTKKTTETKQENKTKNDSVTKTISENKNNSHSENTNTTDVKKETSPLKTDSVHKEKNLLSKNTDCGSFNYSSSEKPFKIALLIPFNITKNRGYVLKGKKKDEEPPVYPKSIKFIEFYQGFLLALDSLKRAGISVDLQVFDTEKDSAKLMNITKKQEFADVDLIVGPFFSTNLKQFSEYAKNNNVAIVSPLSQDNYFLQDNPFAFQVNPTANVQLNEAANYFSNQKDKNFIIINTGKKEDTLLCAHFKKSVLEFYKSKFNGSPSKYKEVIYKEIGFKGIQELLDKENDNIIFIPSVTETFVANILTKLNTLETKFPIYILGTNSWANEDNIEQDYLFNLQYTMPTSMYVDYKAPQVLNFLSQYRSIYNTEPSRYSFCGYDIAQYFLNALKTYGKNFPNCIAQDSKLNKIGLQTEFNFQKDKENNGFENTKTYILQYDKEFNILHVNGLKKE